MIPYLHNAIFKVNSFPESSPSFWMRSGACDHSDPDVAIKAYGVRVPLCSQVHRLVGHKKVILSAVGVLMA